MFRAKFLDSLRRALANHEVRLPETGTGAESIGAFIQTCKECDWVVYAKGSYADREGIFEYLSGYTFRTAIGNERLIG